MTVTVVANGEIVDQGGRRRLDVAVDDDTGVVIDLGPAPRRDRTLDAEGCVVVPGLVDLNTHLRQPGFEAAGTVESGSRGAALGGYTAVIAMPDTEPCTDNAAVVSEILALAKGAPCQVVPAAALTVETRGALLAPLGELAALGVTVFGDANRGLQDPAVFRRALEYLGSVGTGDATKLLAVQRVHEMGLAGDGVMHEGAWSARLGLPGMPALAEELMVNQSIGLAHLTGVPVHLQQISTAASAELVRQAKARGYPVSAEVSPHHLVLDHEAVAGYDPNLKMLPPLREPADVAAMVAAVADGTIDVIASDHFPHTMDAKERPFDQAPFGVIGLETAIAVLLSETELDLEQLLAAMSWQPAALAGLSEQGGPIEVGKPANLAIIDPTAT
ncbi:MAG: dihydroorotase, partial [Actinomycetia bacterium]|nr:dihydroorotase [Actinomycetes bacterium]